MLGTEGACPAVPVTSGVPGERRQEPTPGVCRLQHPMSKDDRRVWILSKWGSRVGEVWLSCSQRRARWLSSCNSYLITQEWPQGLLRPLRLLLQTQALVPDRSLQVTYMQNDSCVGRKQGVIPLPQSPWQGGPQPCLNAPRDGEITPSRAAQFSFWEPC